MKKLADGWNEYYHTQSELIESHSVNDINWGKEHALDRIVDDMQNGAPPQRSNVERYIRTGDRRNRHRRSILRKRRALLEEYPQDVMQSYEAALLLRELFEKIGRRELEVVLQVGSGHSYRDLAVYYGVSVLALRQRVSRTRSKAKKIVKGD